ncbi:hypothetical protein FKM82_023621 [Ascaphus truei]
MYQYLPAGEAEARLALCAHVIAAPEAAGGCNPLRSLFYLMANLRAYTVSCTSAIAIKMTATCKGSHRGAPPTQSTAATTHSLPRITGDASYTPAPFCN